MRHGCKFIMITSPVGFFGLYVSASHEGSDTSFSRNVPVKDGNEIVSPCARMPHDVAEKTLHLQLLKLIDGETIRCLEAITYQGCQSE